MNNEVLGRTKRRFVLREALYLHAEAEARRNLLESRQKKAKSLLEEALKRGFVK